MMDPPRPESRSAVASARQAGIRPVMITGDHKVTAMAIAERIGILTPGDMAATGAELDQMEEEDLDRSWSTFPCTPVCRRSIRYGLSAHGREGDISWP